MWVWQKAAYLLCLHSTKGTVFTCQLPFVPVCYTNKQEFYIKVYDGTWRTLSTPFFILSNLCWTRYRWLTNVVLWIIWMKKMKYCSGNVSTHSRYTLETYFWAVIWLCLWQKILPPHKLSYSNNLLMSLVLCCGWQSWWCIQWMYFIIWCSDSAVRYNRVVLTTQLRMFVVLMCEMEQPYK